MAKTTRYTFKFTLKVDDPEDGTLPCESFCDWSATNNQDCRKHEGEMLAYAVRVLQSQAAYKAFMATQVAEGSTHA